MCLAVLLKLAHNPFATHAFGNPDRRSMHVSSRRRPSRTDIHPRIWTYAFDILYRLVIFFGVSDMVGLIRT